MAGPPPTTELVRLADELQIADLVEFRNHPSDDEVNTLYRQARLLLFPSLYEGFGWPPLEAMACGCPVVCSDAGSLSDVVADSALTADADDHERLAAHCLRVLVDPSLAAELRERGSLHASQYTLDRFANELSNIYKFGTDSA